MHSDNYVELRRLAASQRGLKIISRPRSELKPDLANPRQHSRKQIQQIAKSISTFGFNVPVLVDAELNVIAGHGGCSLAASSAWTRCQPCASTI
jgi:hypothetical protein